MTTLGSLRALPHSFSLSGAVLLLGLSTSLAGPYIPLFGSEVAHMTPLTLGVFMSLLAVSSIGVSLQMGRVSDRLASRKPVVLIAVLAALLGYVLLTTTTSYLALCLICMVFLGTGAASFPQLFAFARSQLGDVAPKAAEHGLTTLRSIFSLAWVVGPGVGALVVSGLGFRGLFLVTALLYALAGVVVLSSGRGRGRSRRVAAPIAAVPRPSGPPPPLALIVASFVLYGASLSMGSIALPLYVTKVLHGSTGDVGLLIGVCALLEIPVMLSFVFLPRRFSNQTLVIFAFGLFVLYFALTWAARGLPLLLLAQGVRAVVIGVAASLGMAYFHDLLPGRVGVATTLFVNTTSAGSMVAGLVSGAFAQVFGYRSVFLLCAGLTVAAWALLLFASRRQQRREAAFIAEV
jgi:SET family sugar efflux transporter-like MFS transporter